MSCFSSRSRLSRRSPSRSPVQLKCYRTVFFGIHGESVADSGTVEVKNKRGWTAALDLSVCVFGPELPLHVRGLSQSPKLRTAAITDICFFIFWIGRVVNGESCSCGLRFCWKRLVFILLGRLWQPGWDPDTRWEVTATSRARERYQISHFMISIHYVYVYINIFVCLYSI